MANYAQAVKKEDPVIIHTKRERSVTPDDPKWFACSRHKPCAVAPPHVSAIMQHFIDQHGEGIYELYWSIRARYEAHGTPLNVDYNGFLELFLNNLHMEEIDDDGDEDDCDGHDKVIGGGFEA